MLDKTMKDSGTTIPELALKLADLQYDLDQVLSERYYNTQPVISQTINNPLMNINFHLTDILLIGAITGASILLSGSSGSGKTFLAESVVEYLFGKDGYARKNITPDMNEQDFMDIDFGVIKDGGKLKDAILPDNLFEKPALIIDEANRAPPIVQNRLLQLLENNIDLKSKTIKAGPTLNNNEHYSWPLLTLNIGQEYAGTSVIDRALKDRIVIHIPIDNFPPTLDDQIKMIRRPMTHEDILKSDSRKSIIFDLFEHLEIINLTLEAEALILYLSFTSNCVKSPTNSKYGINFSPNYCKEQDCPYARNPPLDEICPFTFAPSNRVLRKVIRVAKGFALLKHAKIIHKLRDQNAKDQLTTVLKSTDRWDVDIEDVLSIAPLVLHSKVSINLEWVLNKFNGNTYLAVKHFLKVINTRLNEFMEQLLPQLVKEKRGEKLTEKEKGERERSIKRDFHFEGLISYVEKYLG
ncbi:MAG: AAA family ATPase [Candidatus Helarchaeota archaeon]